MSEVIKNGKKGTAMPAFSGQLKHEEISAVIAYIRSLKKK
jgi:mono/diheme cytochrome c family protein